MWSKIQNIQHKTLKTIFLLCIFFTNIFAQETNSNELEQFEQNQKEIPSLKKELQQNYTIVCSKHNFNLNPHSAAYSIEAQILTGLYEGLFSYNPITLEPNYALCTSFRINRNKKRWVFTLRKGAKFSDGTEITAQDVKNSWLTMLSTPDSPYSSLFDIVAGAQAYRLSGGKTDIDSIGISVIDDSTIAVNLNKPAAHLNKLLCMQAFCVKSASEGVYSGPFVIESSNPEKIVLKKNEQYHDSKKTPLSQITILLSDDEDENSFLFNTGKADWITGTFNSKRIIDKKSIRVNAEFATQYFFFKIKPSSIWNKIDFRAALLEAVPWEKLREGFYVPATTLVYPLNGYKNVEGYSYCDEQNAKFLMKEARQNANIPEDLQLVLTFAIPDSDYMKKKAEILKEAWKTLGVELRTEEIPSASYLDSIQNSNSELFSYTWIGDFADPLAFLELFRSNSTLNVSGWSNQEYDNLLNESSIYSDENHLKLLAQAEQLLLDEAMILPIQHPVSVNVVDLEATGGWFPNEFDIHPLKYLYKKEKTYHIPNIVFNQNAELHKTTKIN